MTRCLPGLMLLLFASRPVHAGERYYMIVFAYQSVPNRGKDSHTFATFVKATSPTDLEYHTISWMPATLVVRPFTLDPEPGRLLTLTESLELAYKNGHLVSMFGPYEIEPILFARSVRQSERLRNGEVLYKPLEPRFDNHQVSNCIHAVSILAELPRIRVGIPGYGESGSYRAVCRMSGYIVNIKRTHDWLIPALGLEFEPILRRSHHEWWLRMPHLYPPPQKKALFEAQR